MRDGDYRRAVQRLHQSVNLHGAVAALGELRRSLGTDGAAFVCFNRYTPSLKLHVLLNSASLSLGRAVYHTPVCRQAWCIHALTNTEPLNLQLVDLLGPELGRTKGTMIVLPAPSAMERGHHGALLLALESTRHEDRLDWQAHALARAAALEFREWWGRFLRRRLIRDAVLTTQDILLLALEDASYSSAQIASRLGLSSTAVDSRFRRLNARLASPSRKESALLARRYGLLDASQSDLLNPLND